MALPRVMPALADLTQDIAGRLPLDLLRTWGEGAQEVGAAEELLSAFKMSVAVESTDTAGLSKMTGERDLLDLLALISGGKSVVHRMGTTVGGRAIGTWVADNTQLYYPDDVALRDVLQAMAGVQCRIADDGFPGLGMCVHRGAFYEIGGGLYGPDAHLVETIAEHHARAGEILVCDV